MISPGDVLRDRVLPQYGLTQEGLAEALGVSRFSVNQIINGRRSITADMALRLARVTRTAPEFWMDMQRDLDLNEARQKLKTVLRTLPRFSKLAEAQG